MPTVFEDDDRLFDSLCAGASGYILKNFISKRLIESIMELQYRGSPMSLSIARKVLGKLQQSAAYIRPDEAPDYKLTSWEKDVLSCVVNGFSYKMIADDLMISYETICSHIQNL